MKALDLPSRARLHQRTKAALKLVDEKKFDEAENICAELKKDLGKTCVVAGVEARIAFGRGDKAGARRHIEDGLRMSAPGDVVFNRISIGVAQGIGDDALIGQALRGALEKTPSDALIRNAAGGYCYRKGRLDAAVLHFQAAVNLKPRFIDAMRSLALVYWEAGQAEQATKVLTRAQDMEPTIRAKVLEVGNQRYGVENHRGAAYAYELVVAFDPLYAAAYSNLGSVYRQLQDFEKARSTLRRSALIDPGSDGAYYNLGNLEKEDARLKASISAFRRALTCNPEKAQLHWNLSLALLADGQLGEGFREYEWRWETDAFPTKKREFEQPEWTGEPLEGRTLLVVAEQGIGDALQFLRFVPEAVKRAQSGKKKGRIILEVHEEALDLHADYADMVELVPRKPGEEPDFDCHIPELSLPLLLGVETTEDLPKSPYINCIGPERFPIPDLDPATLNVGVVWGGNPAFPGDNIRSSSVSHYGPLFELEGIQCYSLQKGPREADLAEAPQNLAPISASIETFADTVSIVRQLDVTVTTCTSVAHLVGGMGCPVYVLLSHNPDWRWLQHRDDSPWYPSARLFRQQTPGDWPGVIRSVAAALAQLRAEKVSG